ncbi:MAG: hypothetical protein IKU82_01705, partial [Clostridia bacterium]|nr:hypothetical protein [Clostridia bacterium]
MAVPVDEGVSQIRFDYKNTGLPIGKNITLICLITLAIYLIISGLLLKRKCVINYPEGDALLESWQADDIDMSENQDKNDEILLNSLVDDIPINNEKEENDET